MSKKPTQLDLLKKQKRWLPIRWRAGVVTRFYSVITVMLMVIFFSFSVLASVGASINTFDEKRSDWVAALTTFFELTGGNRQAVIADIKQELLHTTSPVTNFFLATPVVENQISSVTILLEEWLTAAEPFTDYRFSPEGLVHVKDKSRFFTDDLQNFFTAQTPLFNRTLQTWQNLTLFRMIIDASGNQRLQNLLDLVDKMLEIGTFVFQNPDSVLNFLGHSKPRTVVIFNQNTAEARPTGGFIGSHIPLTITKGRVKIGQSQSIYWIQGSHQTPRTASPFLTNYALAWGTNYTAGGVFDTFNFACFPTSAAFLQREFAESSTGYQIDDVVFITPQVLTQFLPADFTFTVPDVGQISGSELLTEIDRLTALEYDNPQNPKELLTPILDALLARIPDILSHHGLEDLLANGLALVSARDVQMWSLDTATQELFSALNISGEATCQNAQSEDIISPILFNISGDKRNAITTNSWSVSSKTVIGGQRVTVQYQQAIKNPEEVPRGTLNLDLSFTFAGLQIPSNATDLDVYSPQSLRRSFTPNFYYQTLQERINEKWYTAPETSILWETGKDLSPEANPPGFRYNQPDGSSVVGIYIADDMVSTVTYEFTLPVSQPHPVRFVPQSGLNKPLLSLGSGIKSPNGNQTIFNNRFEILSGVPLLID